MLLDAVAAKMLASIIVLSTQGQDVLTKQRPLHVEDRGTAWLVKGTPHDEPKIQAAHVMFHVFIRKDSAEVTGLNFEARFKFAPKVMADWQRRLSKADYARVFGPPTRFEPDGIPEIMRALYGGIVNTPADALAYTQVLMRTKPALAAIPAGDLAVRERDDVWHVDAHVAGRKGEVMSFSRSTGKVLSGDL